MKFGDPVRVAEERRIRLHSFYYGVLASWMDPVVATRSLQLFAEEVMPRFSH